MRNFLAAGGSLPPPCSQIAPWHWWHPCLQLRESGRIPSELQPEWKAVWKLLKIRYLPPGRTLPAIFRRSALASITRDVLRRWRVFLFQLLPESGLPCWDGLAPANRLCYSVLAGFAGRITVEFSSMVWLWITLRDSIGFSGWHTRHRIRLCLPEPLRII